MSDLTIPSVADLVAAAEGIAPLIAAAAPMSEEARRVPDSSIRAM
ncbi:MAG: hypothetical protein QOJ19_2656, partial [Acidimicrobiia bacterium]|nr:hypothetical protein [Acidimicrobiia bacterium]